MSKARNWTTATRCSGSGVWLAWMVVASVLSSRSAGGHGSVGDRFFPPTIQTEDPFAADELALPTVSTIKNPGSPATRETDASVEFNKLLFPRFALGFSETYVILSPQGGATTGGFDNLSLNVKYQCWENAPHEAVLSAGMEWEVGGTGSHKVGAEATHVLTPTVFYGKGFGDLPVGLRYAQPLALTGTVGQTFPIGPDPNVLEWGVAVEYSLPYLQTRVKDIGLPGPIRNFIPLVELAMSTPENREGGSTTGTINPGLLYEHRYFQLGAEAVIPVNAASGSHVGVVFQVEIYLDDIWPKAFGFPLIGGKTDR